MISIPGQEKKFIQTNQSKIFGNLWSSFNLDVTSNKGTLRLSPRLKLNTSTADDAQLGTPVAFKWFDTLLWTICGGSVFSNSGIPNANFTEDASTGAQTDFSADESDMELFNGTLCATTTDGLYSKATSGTGTGAWTSRDTLSTGGQHVLCYFKKYDRLYYSDLAATIRSIDTSWSTADPGASYAILLAADTVAYTITSMRSTSQVIWIGIMDLSDKSGIGKVLKWDGISSTISEQYNLPSGCMAIAIDPVQDIPYVIDAYGILYGFTGNGFREVGRLPISSKRLFNTIDVDAADRFIHPNGLIYTKEGTIRALVNNKNADSTYNENFQSGIYEFDLKGSCIHVGSLSYTNDTTITDFGQSRLSRVGALAQMDVYSTSGTRNGTFLCGADYFTDATTTTSGIFYDDSNDVLQKSGYFVTTQILSSQITDLWQRLYIRFKKFLNSTDKIIVKYRIEETEPTEISITWVNTTSFTTTTNLTSMVGYEIEVVNGTGAGQCSHIVSVTGTGTYTVTVDETYTGVTTGTAKARYQNWKKMGSYTLQTAQYVEFPIQTPEVWMQLKVCMKWTGKNEIYDLIISNITNQKV